jgi:methionine-rich copper-binding protein CopC
MTHAIRSRSVLARLAIGFLLVLLVPAAVSAHTELETATPAADSTVPSPFDGPILLTFTEELAGGSKADLLGPDGGAIATATVDGPAAAMLFELDAPLDPGDYEIEWTGVGVDAHVERGTVSFIVASAPPTEAPSPTQTSAPSASAAPATPSPEPVSSTSPLPSPTPAEPTDSSGSGEVVLPIVVGLLVVAAGAAYLLSRRGRPSL